MQNNTNNIKKEDNNHAYSTRLHGKQSVHQTRSHKHFGGETDQHTGEYTPRDIELAWAMTLEELKNNIAELQE